MVEKKGFSSVPNHSEESKRLSDSDDDTAKNNE
jgi:hypothetical protein